MRSATREIDSAGIVDIYPIRRTFFTSSIGAPDMLFPSLLMNAREAYTVTSGGADLQDRETTEKKGFSAAVYMCGLLLCEDQFVPARVSSKYEHQYRLDFSAGLIGLRTQIYTVDPKSSSLFSIKFEGRIRENSFVVRSAVTDHVLVKFSEEEMAAPNFFTRELPFACNSARLDPTLAKASAYSALVDQRIDLQFVVEMNGKPCTVQVLKEKGELNGRILDPKTGQFLSALPLDQLNNLGQLVASLPERLASRAKTK